MSDDSPLVSLRGHNVEYRHFHFWKLGPWVRLWFEHIPASVLRRCSHELQFCMMNGPPLHFLILLTAIWSTQRKQIYLNRNSLSNAFFTLGVEVRLHFSMFHRIFFLGVCTSFYPSIFLEANKHYCTRCVPPNSSLIVVWYVLLAYSVSYLWMVPFLPPDCDC